MKTRFGDIAVATSGTGGTVAALAPANTYARTATLVAAAGNSAPVTVGPNAQVTAVAVAAGGSGYAVGDVLVVQGGTSTQPCMLMVLTLGSSGAVATVTIKDAGSYSILPAAGASVSVPASGGTLATFNLTATTPGALFTVQPGQSCPLWSGFIPYQFDPVDLGDWCCASTASTQNGLLSIL